MRYFLLAAFSAVTCFAQLQGVTDIHTHGDPDSRPRKLDVIEWARSAKAAGMRAIVLKNHYAPTAQAAYLVRQVVPGIEVYAGFSLDGPVGGLNVQAVEQANAFKGQTLRIVWMPTFDSENDVKFAKANRPFVAVSKNGRLLPEAPGQSNPAHPRVGAREPLDGGPSPVRAPVVDQHELISPLRRAELKADGLVQRLEVGLFVVNGYDDAQIDHLLRVRFQGPGSGF